MQYIHRKKVYSGVIQLTVKKKKSEMSVPMWTIRRFLCVRNLLFRSMVKCQFRCGQFENFDFSLCQKFAIVFYGEMPK